VRRYGWDREIISLEQAADVIKQSLESFECYNFGIWCIFLCKSQDLIGYCGLDFLENSTEAKLLYGLTPRYWGKDFATETSIPLLQYGFENCNLTRIV
jgi:ribosomal-protein-alanine N-acetyltransferase